MTVPADEAELLAEFRRHGVRPGSRLHVVLTDESAAAQEEMPAYFGSPKLAELTADDLNRAAELVDQYADFPLGRLTPRSSR
jgi:hypothetical protein